jgi:hypothetical protein
MAGIAGAGLTRVTAAAARAFAQLARLGGSGFGVDAGAAGVALTAAPAFSAAACTVGTAFTGGPFPGWTASAVAPDFDGAAAFADAANPETAALPAGTAAAGGREDFTVDRSLCAFTAAAILLAAAASEAVRAIGTRAVVRAEAVSLTVDLPAAVAGESDGDRGAAADTAAGDTVAGDTAAAGAGGAVSRSSTTGSSSSRSSAVRAALIASFVAAATGTTVGFCPAARNSSGSTKLSPVCPGSWPSADPAEGAGLRRVTAKSASGADSEAELGLAGAAEPPGEAVCDSRGAAPGSCTFSTGRSGSGSSRVRDAASIRELSKQRPGGHCFCVAHRSIRGLKVRDAAHTRRLAPTEG